MWFEDSHQMKTNKTYRIPVKGFAFEDGLSFMHFNGYRSIIRHTKISSLIQFESTVYL